MSNTDVPVTFLEKLLLQQLQAYFIKNPQILDECRLILEKNHCVSLRMLEFITTNLARKQEVGFFHRNDDGEIRYVDIYTIYKNTLGDYKKTNFDSFQRSSRIYFKIDGRVGVKTTIGQLVWLRFIFENKIMDWTKMNRNYVQSTMARALKAQRDNRKMKKLPKRMTLSKVHYGHCRLRFH